MGAGVGMPLTNARVRKMRGAHVNNLLESNRTAIGGQSIRPNQQGQTNIIGAMAATTVGNN